LLIVLIYIYLKGRYKLGLLTIVIAFPLSFASMMFVTTSAPFLALIPIIIVWWFDYAYYGKYGHIWREEKLISNGFEHVATLEAETENGAIAEYMRKKI